MQDSSRQDPRQPMIEGYIDAAIRQAQERARILKAKISYSSQVNEFIALRQTCDNFIDGLIDDFGYLLTDSVILRQDLVAERIRLFRRLRADLTNVETTAVAALARSHADDASLSRLVADIHREIRCPLAPPTVTSLSREYLSRILFNQPRLPSTRGSSGRIRLPAAST